MNKTLTRTRPQFTPAPAQFEAGLVWVDDLPTWPTTPAPAPAPAPEPAPAVDPALARKMFRTYAPQLRTLGFTPTGRERKGAEAEAARAELARRASR